MREAQMTGSIRKAFTAAKRFLAVTGVLAVSACSGKAPVVPPAPAAPPAPAEVVQVSGQPAHVKGTVMVKLAPVGGATAAVALREDGSIPADDAALARVRAVAGVKGARRQFEGARPSSGTAMLRTPDGEAVRVPDLSRWYRVDLDPAADVMAKVAEMKRIAGVAEAEPA
ncbi:MAG TPA: hypothetical protein VFM45_13835, partial [Anaeromyxobacteraceae bacterium]|nr:hypothetical protein [Anaeromyxobacteraceae bacterium]